VLQLPEVGLSVAVLDTLDDPLVELPVTTHDPPVGHDNPEIATKPGGGAALLQVAPALVLAKKTGAVAPELWAPAATQDVADEHETSRTEADAAGNVTALKVAPPSVVSMASPGTFGTEKPDAFGPTATQTVDDGQVMERSWPVPPFTAATVHVNPASWLTRTFEPTAMHVVVVGQAMSAIPATKAGT
jgi:hypothetical protein